MTFLALSVCRHDGMTLQCNAGWLARLLKFSQRGGRRTLQCLGFTRRLGTSSVDCFNALLTFPPCTAADDNNSSGASFISAQYTVPQNYDNSV